MRRRIVSLSSLLSQQDPLVVPIGYDAISTRLIERAGFPIAGLGGFGIVGFRYGLPDLDLVGFGEMSAAVRDIAQATSIPLIVDADTGYGDVKNVYRTVRTYEDMGISAIILEDQVSPKSCGHMGVLKRLVSADEHALKLRAAVDARTDGSFSIIARTDARGIEGLEAAIDRGKRYADQGIAGLFIEAPRSIQELEAIGKSFDIPLIINAAESGGTPILTPNEYKELGFSIVFYTSSLFLRVIEVIQYSLEFIKRGEFPEGRLLPSFKDLTDIMGLPAWAEIGERYS
ncbi:isocitrate lyase/PEP mutase family protein [Flavisphingomonas formosensis]|uniref:isocitrate lyase/PEP mutase family protein n=1 Tax=Flavisphingomonas formosensis TaxID=861534 RepID=UPI0012FB9964|nr:isocitrate lyase/PEP mutase family protein [Sphingomonas formosensis]